VKPSFELQDCWPLELRLLAAAAARRLDAPARARCAALLAEAPDWPRLLQWADAHALAPLLARSLAGLELPLEVAAALHATHQEHVRSNLALAAELGRLAGALRRASVFVVAYKGPALAQRLYGDVGLRSFSDLDLLVDPVQRERAAEVLLAAGYARFRPIADRARQSAGDCEEQFLSHDGRFFLDLHWEIAQPYYSFGSLPEGWKARVHHLSFAGEAVPTFGDGDNLLVLAVHGGKHRWERLSWLADTAAAIDAGGFDWDAVLLAATEMRARYHLLLAATLAHSVFGVDVPESILQAARDAGTPWRFAGAILATYASGRPAPLLARWHYGLRMREDWRDRARVAVRFLTRPGSLELEEPLPAGRAFLYPALRAGRVAARAWKAAAGADRTASR